VIKERGLDVLDEAVLVAHVFVAHGPVAHGLKG